MEEEKLTREERDLVRTLGTVYTRMTAVTGTGPTRAADLDEIRHHVHALQRMLMAQAAARIYPGEFRLLGELVQNRPLAVMSRKEQLPRPAAELEPLAAYYGSHDTSAEMEEDTTGAAEAFLQWKNTDACLDLACPCGAGLHFDGFFARELTCGHCAQTWQLQGTVQADPILSRGSNLKILFDGEILGDEEVTFPWPRPLFPVAAGKIAELHDDLRSVHAVVTQVEPGIGTCVVQARVQGAP